MKGQGKIEKVSEYHLFCAGDGCYQNYVYHGWRKKSAEKQMREAGWSKKIDGLWYCPYCKEADE